MKKLFSINLLIALAVVLASCGTNNTVVNNRLISKRKFNKGFHINTKGNMKSSNEKKQEESIAFNDEKKSSVKPENTATKATKRTEKKAELVEKTVVESEEVAFSEIKSEYAENRVSDSAIEADFDSESIELNEVEEVDNTKEEMPAKSLTKKEAKRKVKSAAAGGNSDLVNIILIVLLVLVILALISLIGGTLGWILSVVVLVLIVYFLLKLLGVIG